MFNSITIIGSGLTGLMLAHELKSASIHSLLIDKGRKPGGRISTKVLGDCIFDTGPGWFHTDIQMTPSAIYSALLAIGADPVPAADLPISVRFGLPETISTQSWKIPGSIRQLAEELAKPLEILKSLQLVKISRNTDFWTLQFKDSAHGGDPFELESKHVVLTMPWPQILELLMESDLIDLMAHQDMPEIPDYERCLVGIFQWPGLPAPFDQTGFFEPLGHPLIRLLKFQPVSSGNHSITVQASPDWSLENWDLGHAEILKELQLSASAILKMELQPSASSLHKWKYARLQPSPNPSSSSPVILCQNPFLMVAGEAFGMNTNFRSGILASQNSAKLAARSILS